MNDPSNPERREFLKASLASVAGAAAAQSVNAADEIPTTSDALRVVDQFDRPDSLQAGDAWESLNPGYFEIKEGALRRKLHNVGDRAPVKQFPWHWETHHHAKMPTSVDPSLPLGILWRRDWRLTGNYTLRIEGRIRGAAPHVSGSPWKMHKPGYGLVGIAFGGQCLHESWTGGARPGSAAWLALWRDSARLGIYDHAAEPLAAAGKGAETTVAPPKKDDQFVIEVQVVGAAATTADVVCTLTVGAQRAQVRRANIDRKKFLEGYLGIATRGLVDWQIKRVLIDPGKNQPLDTPQNELHVCYALGDTLRQTPEGWRCRFVALLRNDGQFAEVRIATQPDPPGGWAKVPAAGRAPIVTNDFRASTAAIDALLPADPGETDLFYTVWKDGRDVTADPRLGTASVGPGTGFVGAVPATGSYVGRLPRLAAPYRVCGLSCHAISENLPELPHAAKFEENWVHDQPSARALQSLEDFEFQVMLWEDDVWYLELIFAPPSTQDAYKVIQTTLGGPTTRWQMMRHWNVLNPGDHDYGMDDVKGPEQFILRNRHGLGQDPDYLRRNFQMVAHLCQGEEQPSATENPRRWRRWKMPHGDFSLLVVDSRLWRTSQDTHIWDDEGWGGQADLYSRRDPTRTLLGEEQFAWLQEMITTDSSPLICVTGINALHPVWGGTPWGESAHRFDERDRVAADLAGWVKAGVQRVLDLLGRREGIVAVYGDVHTGSILINPRQRLYECSFGPIGRTGSRSLKADFGQKMTDFNGCPVEVIALYHEHYGSPRLERIKGPTYWNFLEMEFDPRERDGHFALRLRNLIDAPTDAPRGGGAVAARASQTGREPTSRLPEVKILPHAHVQLATTEGRALRGSRATADGRLTVSGLVDVPPGTQIVLTARTASRVEAQIVVTLPPTRSSDSLAR